MDSAVPLAALTAASTGRSQAFPTSPGSGVELEVVVSKATENSSLSLWVSWSDDGGTFSPAGATPDLFDDMSVAGTARRAFTAKGSFFRLNWAVTGAEPKFEVLVSQRMTEVVKADDTGTMVDASAEPTVPTSEPPVPVEDSPISPVVTEPEGRAVAEPQPAEAPEVPSA